MAEVAEKIAGEGGEATVKEWIEHRAVVAIQYPGKEWMFPRWQFDFEQTPARVRLGIRDCLAEAAAKDRFPSQSDRHEASGRERRREPSYSRDQQPRIKLRLEVDKRLIDAHPWFGSS